MTLTLLIHFLMPTIITFIGKITGFGDLILKCQLILACSVFISSLNFLSSEPDLVLNWLQKMICFYLRPINSYGHVGTVASDFVGLQPNIEVNEWHQAL